MTELVFNTENWKKDVNQVKQVIPTLELVPETHTILSETLPEFDFSNPPVDPNLLASSLVETCKQNHGIGLSANQCGLPYRVFVMGAEDEFVAFFNPKILNTSTETSHMQEGCISFPFLGLMITRPSVIDVEYQDFTGEKKTAKFSGITARCFQHELDHMNGIKYTSRAKPLALKMALDKRKKTIANVRKKYENMATQLRNRLPEVDRDTISKL
jgi:peptide deformylase